MANKNKQRFSIYKIFNPITGRGYIGCTGQIVFERINRHRKDLRRGVHANEFMQQDWNDGQFKYEFEVLETAIMSKTAARKLELMYISLESNPYNIRRGNPGDMNGRRGCRKARQYIYQEVSTLVHLAGFTTARIANIFGISPAWVCYIRRGKCSTKATSTSFAECWTCEETRTATPAANAESYQFYKEMSHAYPQVA